MLFKVKKFIIVVSQYIIASVSFVVRSIRVLRIPKGGVGLIQSYWLFLYIERGSQAYVSTRSSKTNTNPLILWLIVYSFDEISCLRHHQINT